MKVLIIGAQGMLGQALVRVFREANEVAAWDKAEADITKNAECRRRILELKPEVVVNAAAYTDVDGAESHGDLADQINGQAVGNLASVANELNIPIVHFSTEYVFDGQKNEGYGEDDAPAPISAYGRSKLLGERALPENTEKFYLIRLSRLFGRAGSGKKSFVDTMLDLAGQKKEIEAVDEEWSCPTFAPDLAERTRFIIEQKKPFGIYHCPNSGACTWYGFAKEIFKIARRNVRLIAVPAERFPRQAKRPKYGILLNTKLPPMRPWQGALKDYLSSYFL